MCYYRPKIIETILSMRYVHTLHYNKCQYWDPILTAVSVLNMYVDDDLNSLDTYTWCIVHEHDSVVVKNERTNYICGIACVLYST